MQRDCRKMTSETRHLYSRMLELILFHIQCSPAQYEKGTSWHVHLFVGGCVVVLASFPRGYIRIPERTSLNAMSMLRIIVCFVVFHEEAAWPYQKSKSIF